MGEIYTAQDLANRTAQEILSYALPDFASSPLMPWLGGMVTSPVLRMLGIKDPASSVLATDMTKSGVYGRMTASRINQMSSAFSSQLSHDILADRLRDIERTRMGSYEQWNRANGGNHTATEYNDIVESEVDAWFRRPGFEGLYNLANQALGFDPTSLRASQLMGQTAQNILKRGIYTGGRSYASLGIGTLNRLFSDANGNPERFNSSAWNGFDQGSVAALAEVLTRETDVLEGIDSTSGASTDRIKNAGDRFKERVKKLTDALAPLKDVFGNDIDKMVDTIESMTGQSIGTMSASKLNGLSAQIADRVNSGLYNVEEMKVFNNLMNSRMESMQGLSPYNYISGSGQALRVLDMLKGAQQPDSLTNRQWQSAAMSYVSSTTNAQAADLYAKAYSVWAHNRGQGLDTSTQAFDAEIARREASILRQSGVRPDRRSLWLGAAGLSYAIEADQGMAYDYYRKAIESGEAGRASGYASLDHRINIGATLIGMNQGFMNALELSSSDDAATMYRKIMGEVDNNTNIRSMSSEERLKYFMTDRGMSEEQATRINAGLTYMEANRNMKLVLNQVSLRAGERKMAEANARASRRKKRLEGIETQLLNPDSGIFAQLISGGLSINSINERLRASGIIDEQGEDPDDIAAIIHAGKSGADAWYKKDDKDGKKAFMTSLLQYSMSGEAMASADFEEALQSYAKARKETEGATEREQIADLEHTMQINRNVMVGFMDVGTKAMKDFLNSSPNKGKVGDYKDQNKDMLEGILSQARRSGVKVRTVDAMNMVIAGNRISQLEDAKVKELYEAYKTSGWVDENKDNMRTFGEGFSKFYESHKGKDAGSDRALDQLKTIIQGLGGTASPGLESILTLLNDALNKLVAVLNGENKDKPAVPKKVSPPQAGPVPPNWEAGR